MQIPRAKMSSGKIWHTPRRLGVFGRFEIGPGDILRKIARVAIPEDKPKYHEAQPSGIFFLVVGPSPALISAFL